MTSVPSVPFLVERLTLENNILVIRQKFSLGFKMLRKGEANKKKL